MEPETEDRKDVDVGAQTDKIFIMSDAQLAALAAGRMKGKEVAMRRKQERLDASQEESRLFAEFLASRSASKEIRSPVNQQPGLSYL
jgi:hypothetical protein